MRRSRLIPAASIIISFAAAGFWGLAASSTWARTDVHALAIEAAAAAAASVIAVDCALACWRARGDQRRALLIQNQELLIRTLADAVPARPPARTVPFPRAL